MNKSEIRQKILKIRKKHKVENFEISFHTIVNILRKKKFRGKILGSYYPYNYEMDTMQILKRFEKLNYTITLPKIGKNSEMDFFVWSSKEPLSINKYGIPEPLSSEVKYPDVLFVPLVAFDKNFNRIGYGSGFYDRYIQKIKKIKKIITIGFAYSFQRVRRIPTSKYDIKLDFIITEKKN